MRPDDAAIAAEPALPQRIAQHDDAIPAGLVFTGDERAPEGRRNTERAEQIGSDPQARQALRAVTRRERGAPRLRRRDPSYERTSRR